MDSGLKVAISIYVYNLDLELRDSMVNWCCKIGEFEFLSSGAL